MKIAKPAMETKNNGAAVMNPPYEDFEPFCNWRHDDGRETLVVHLPAFKKEQLKVEIKKCLRKLKIFGERPLDATKKSRFCKEITIPKDCNAKEIRANFVGGLLYIVIPKKDSSAPEQEQPPQPQLQKSEVNEKSTPEISHDDQVAELPTLAKTSSAAENITSSPNNATLPGNIARDSRLKSLRKMATNVAVVAAMVACLGAYIMFSYRSLYGED